MIALSYQLYSSRMFPPLNDTLHMLADIGYAHVEGYGALLAEPELLNILERGLSDTGLTMPSCHVGLDLCEVDPEAVADIARRLGIKTIVIPFIMPDDRPDDADGWRGFGARLAAVGGALAPFGLRLAYHNHDFEFVPLSDGALPIDLILGAAPEVLFEYDVAWAVRAGADPFLPISQHGDRIAFAHLKDIAPDGDAADEDGWADVGHGTMDWGALFAALRSAGTEGFIVEHDNPSDHRRFAQRAFDAVSRF